MGALNVNIELRYGQTIEDLSIELANRYGLHGVKLLNVHGKELPLVMPIRGDLTVTVAKTVAKAVAKP